MLSPTSLSLTKMNLVYRAAIFSTWRSRPSGFFSTLVDSYRVLRELTKSLSFLTHLGGSALGHASFTLFMLLRYDFVCPSTAIPTNSNM